MRRIARLLTVLLTPAVAVGLAAAPANAINVVDRARAMLVLETGATFNGDSVTFWANAQFVGGLVPNSVVAIRGAGTATYTDARGVVLTLPVQCHGESIRFDSSGSAQCTASVYQADSIVISGWTAEAVGLAPGVFLGMCEGVAARAGSSIVVPTC